MVAKSSPSGGGDADCKETAGTSTLLHFFFVVFSSVSWWWQNPIHLVEVIQIARRRVGNIGFSSFPLFPCFHICGRTFSHLHTCHVKKKVKKALVNVFHTGADVEEINC
jgi:hypothetical protein